MAAAITRACVRVVPSVVSVVSRLGAVAAITTRRTHRAGFGCGANYLVTRLAGLLTTQTPARVRVETVTPWCVADLYERDRLSTYVSQE